MSPRRLGTRRLLAWGLFASTSSIFGCGLAQRPSLKIVDPELMATGTALERERQSGGFSLGPYSIHDVGMRSEAPDPDGPLMQDGVARPVTQHRAGLVLDGAEGRAWTTACRLQRRAPRAADYRAVLDENGDEIAVECTAKTRGLPPWRFESRAMLSQNFVGSLGPEGAPAMMVEILTRAVRFKRLERVLPVPVAQLREGEDATVAVLLGRPERAFVDRRVQPVTVEATLAMLLTLRYLPWELAE